MIDKGPLWNFSLLFVLYTVVTFITHIETWSHLCAVALLLGISYMTMKYVFLQTPDKRNYLISGCILYLLFHPPSVFAEYAILGLVIVLFTAGKFLREGFSPFINPIVFALLCSQLLLSLFGISPFISWWGTAYMGSWSLLWLSPVALFGAYAFKRLWLFASYILVLGTFSVALGDSSWLFVFGTGTIYFVSGIMLIEPKTSPVLRRDQLIFGIAFGVITFAIPPIVDKFLIGIALMNLGFMLKKKFTAQVPIGCSKGHN